MASPRVYGTQSPYVQGSPMVGQMMPVMPPGYAPVMDVYQMPQDMQSVSLTIYLQNLNCCIKALVFKIKTVLVRNKP